MPRVHFVKKARKDNPVAKRGESYYWWKFNFGPTMYSLTSPKPSQLTRSEFLSTYLGIGEGLGEDVGAAEEWDDLRSAVESAISSIEELQSETEDKLNNVPESLQSGPTAELLQERIDGLESWRSELEGIDLDDEEQEIGDVKDQITGADPGIS